MVMIMNDVLSKLIQNYPCMESGCETIEQVNNTLISCFENGGKLLVCGNGGSCADSEHIVGELMKGFLKNRPLSASVRERMKA